MFALCALVLVLQASACVIPSPGTGVTCNVNGDQQWCCDTTTNVCGMRVPSGATMGGAAGSDTFFLPVINDGGSNPTTTTTAAATFSIASSSTFGDNYLVAVGTVPVGNAAGVGTGFLDATNGVTNCPAPPSTGACNTNPNLVLNPIAVGRKPAIKIFCSNSVFACAFVTSSSLNICWDRSATAPPATVAVTSVGSSCVTTTTAQIVAGTGAGCISQACANGVQTTCATTLPVSLPLQTISFQRFNVPNCPTATTSNLIASYSIDATVCYSGASLATIGGYLQQFFGYGTFPTNAQSATLSCTTSGLLAARTYTTTTCTGASTDTVPTSFTVRKTCTADGAGGSYLNSNPCVPATAPPTAAPTAAPTAPPSSGGSCFHTDTSIAYKGAAYKMADFERQSAPECRIPHVVESDGVRIVTECGQNLGVTADHLVYTTRGSIPASSIVGGDTVYTSLDESKQCRVKSVTHEQQPQRYFGLNCLESVVVANGIRASTFGRYHYLPAAWMKYAGALIGIDRASAIGDAVAGVLLKIGVL